MTKIYSRGNRNKSIYKISKVVLIDFEQDMALYVARGNVAPLVLTQNSWDAEQPLTWHRGGWDSQDIFGKSLEVLSRSLPEVSYPLKYSNWSHYDDNSTCNNQNSSGSDWNSWGSSFSRASALTLSTNSTAFLSYKAWSFPSLSALCGSAPDSELLEKRVLLMKGRPGIENSEGTSLPSLEMSSWFGISSRSNQRKK